jgi:proline iminopeptidase
MSYADFVAFRKSLPRTPRLERQTVRARGVTFAVFASPPVDGAQPLVCINGGMLYDHAMLWPALSPLAARRQVILYDQRGRGASTAPARPLDASIDDDALDVGALRRALGVRQWDVLGHSWGGGIAMLAAAADVAGTRKLVLVDAVSPTSDWMPVLRHNVLAHLAGHQRDAVAGIPEEALGAPDAELHSRYARAVYPAWFADPDMASHFSPPEASSDTGAAALARLRREGYDWRDRLRVLSTAPLVIHGEADPLPILPPTAFPTAPAPAVLPERAVDLAFSRDDPYMLNNGRRVVVPSSGHMPFWEAPQRFFSLIDSFL